jgi:hypothetical protein
MPDGRGVLFLDTRTGSKLKYYDLARRTRLSQFSKNPPKRSICRPATCCMRLRTGGLFADSLRCQETRRLGTPDSRRPDLQPNGGISPFDVTITQGRSYIARASSQNTEFWFAIPSGKIDTLPIAPKIIVIRTCFHPTPKSLAVDCGAARWQQPSHSHLRSLASPTHAIHAGRRRSRTAFGHQTANVSPSQRTISGGERGRHLCPTTGPQHAGGASLLDSDTTNTGSAWPTDSMLVFRRRAHPGALGGSVSGGGRFTGGDPHCQSVDAGRGLRARTSRRSGANSRRRSHRTVNGRIHVDRVRFRRRYYVRPFPVANAGGIVKISSGGGQRARWSGDGRTV